MVLTLVTIQGNIGAGKSTLLEHLKTATRARKDICVLSEPVDEWDSINDGMGNTMLALFYGDQQRHAFAFQMMAYVSRLALLRRTIKQGYKLIISERSLTCDREVFARMLANDGKLSQVEYKIYLRWFEEFTRDLPEERIFYIRTSPETAAKRVAKRGREGESVSLEYLTRCHDYHERWINQHAHQVVNGDVSAGDTDELFRTWATALLAHLPPCE